MKIGDKFREGKYECTIVSEATFSGEEHWGFTWFTDTGTFCSGWMPKEFVKLFTGHVEQEPEEPDVDDTVKCCPDCERPNQFGEVCPTCEHEARLEAYERNEP